MNSVLNKALKFFNGEDLDEYEDAYEEEMSERAYTKKAYDGRNTKVVPMSKSSMQAEILGFRPVEFNDAGRIADALKDRKAVLFDVNNLKNKDDARRIVDYIAGVINGIDGDMKKLTDGIFSAAPSNFALDGEFVTDESR